MATPSNPSSELLDADMARQRLLLMTLRRLRRTACAYDRDAFQPLRDEFLTAEDMASSGARAADIITFTPKFLGALDRFFAVLAQSAGRATILRDIALRSFRAAESALAGAEDIDVDLEAIGEHLCSARSRDSLEAVRTEIDGLVNQLGAVRGKAGKLTADLHAATEKAANGLGQPGTDADAEADESLEVEAHTPVGEACFTDLLADREAAVEVIQRQLRGSPQTCVAGLCVPDLAALRSEHGVEVANQVFDHIYDELGRAAGRAILAYRWRGNFFVFLVPAPLDETALSRVVHELTHDECQIAAAGRLSTVRVRFRVSGGLLQLKRAGSWERAIDVIDGIAEKLAA